MNALMPCAAEAAVSLTGLGEPAGSAYTLASGVSADGRVVVGARIVVGETEGFRWTREDGMTPLLDLSGGESRSAPFAANQDGSLVVGISYADAGALAVQWTSSMPQIIVNPTSVLQFNHATDISRDGSVIVGAGTDGTHGSAARWTEQNGVELLGVLPGPTQSTSTAWAVSADGAVVVGENESANGVQAFRWTHETGMIGLGNLPGPSPYSIANDISEDGRVIVGMTSSRGYYDAFRWTQERGMVALRDLGPSNDFGYDCMALGANQDGSVIVGSGYRLSNAGAMIWNQAEGMRSLWEVLLENGVNPADDGWTTLSEAADITPDGLTIIGTGLRAGHSEAFVVTLPEPALLVSILVVFGGRRVWRSVGSDRC